MAAETKWYTGRTLEHVLDEFKNALEEMKNEIGGLGVRIGNLEHADSCRVGRWSGSADQVQSIPRDCEHWFTDRKERDCVKCGLSWTDFVSEQPRVADEPPSSGAV